MMLQPSSVRLEGVLLMEDIRYQLSPDVGYHPAQLKAATTSLTTSLSFRLQVSPFGASLSSLLSRSLTQNTKLPPK